ncbi:hypothetical protein K503DRAFT_863495 [Rhizopogon vinicolor AM-OR11-026]|uniref:Uncharacterized protein n=1 Tax=Rhizopogon vinicolor AM-OR11-026 TaxID=1314800 RepID=A0A1B7NAL5_9AGAM|nr:hypothetical protein K503DRAFT_863495 [Rhizopogon vinicolor AM-OR11-026]
MQGGFLTEDDLEKYFVYGEYSFTSFVPAPPSPSCGYNWQQPHSTSLGVGGPSDIRRRPSVSPWHESVYRVPEACVHQPLPSGSGTNSSCCNTTSAPDPMSEANIWSRMVTRPSLKRSRRRMCSDMQQDVLNIVRIDDCLSAESATVVEGPISGSELTPRTYLGNKPPEKTTNTTDEKTMHSIQPDSRSSVRFMLGAETGEKGKCLEKHASHKSCFLGNTRLKNAWNRLRCWTATTLTHMKSTARLPSTSRPIR